MIPPPANTRPQEIEAWSNRLVVHRLSAALLPRAIALGIHPNTVTIAGLLFGLAAAAAYTRWDNPWFATLGFLLMIGWHVMDGLDGALARATGKTSAFGRLLDGIADYSTFVAVGLALAFAQDNVPLALLLALSAGAAHALQSAFYEAERETYIRRSRGVFTATVRSEAGGVFERLYNRGEEWLGNRTRPFDQQLARTPPAQRDRLLADWRAMAAPRLMLLSPLSANGRTIAIWLACLAGSPFLYWIWELLGLTLLALAGGHWLRQAEQRPGAAQSGPPPSPSTRGF
jgi:CDP-diacylglycerol---serine O-phosphatidyltransferase